MPNPAIGPSGDVHAWLVRGFVEAGLPDHTGGGVPWREDGALDLENLFVDQGAGGLLLEFAAPDGDEYTYTVKVVRDAGGTRVVVRCPESLYREELPADRPEALAADIVARVRHHQAAFAKWRAEGGETTWAERSTIADDRGAACERALVVFLEGLRKQGRALAGGPKAGWWVTARPAVGAITAGLGKEPEYRLHPEVPAREAPENLEHVARLRTVGMVMIVNGAVALLVGCAGLAYGGWGAYTMGFRGLYGALGVAAWLDVAAFAFAALQIGGGVAMRALRWGWLAKLAAWSGMIPCFGPCWLTGLPVGLWATLVLRDERTRLVFA